MSIKMFRNATIYRINSEELPQLFSLSDDLQEALASKKAREPASQEISAIGFVPPFSRHEDAELFEHCRGAIYLMVEKAERLLPGKAIRQAVEKKVAEIEANECRKVYAKERSQIKDDIIMAKLPQTLVQNSRTAILIDWPYVIVDSASSKKADEALTTLRHALGSLPVRPVATKLSPGFVMTEWAKHGPQSDYTMALGEAFKCSVPSGNGQTLSGSNVDLGSEPVQQALSNGYQITELELRWTNADSDLTHSMTLSDKLAIKRINWDTAMVERVSADIGEDDSFETQMRATLLLVRTELQFVIRELLSALGGEQEPQGVSEDLI